MSSATELRDRRRDALARRLLDGALGTIDLHTVYLGDRLGLYRQLAKGAATAGELAAATGTAERHVRGWLEQQAVSGLLGVDDGAAPPERRRYALPPGHAEVLVDRDDPAYSSALARMMVGMVRPLPRVLEAFRSGGGVPYAEYGADLCDGQGETNRVRFLDLLASRWSAALPDVDARLRADPPARVLDVGCGTGWSTIAIAEAYPKARLEGIDLDPYSIGVASKSAAGAGLDGRVRFLVDDASDPALDGPFDLVCAFDVLRDLPDPAGALRTLRSLLVRDGSMVVAEARVDDPLIAPADAGARMVYGCSVLHRLPVAIVAAGATAAGRPLGPETLRDLASAAGFRRVDDLPTERDRLRFYRLLG